MAEAEGCLYRFSRLFSRLSSRYVLGNVSVFAENVSVLAGNVSVFVENVSVFAENVSDFAENASGFSLSFENARFMLKV